MVKHQLNSQKKRLTPNARTQGRTTTQGNTKVWEYPHYLTYSKCNPGKSWAKWENLKLQNN